MRRLRGALLAQTTPDAVAGTVRWADRDGGGLVVTGRDGLASAQRVLDDGFGQPVLVDAARYVRNRADGGSRLSESWIEWQRAAGLAVALTDSPFVGKGDGDGLCSVLTQAACLGPDVVAVLPLHASWLVEDIDRLCAEVAATEIPVALVVEHHADPLGAPAIVDGLLRLMLLGVPVMVLRANISVLGVLCFGGHAAAVGLRANLRRGPVRRGVADRPAVLVPQLLRFVDLDRLDSAMLADPRTASPLWRCDCEVCTGIELSWLGIADQPREAADSHAVSAMLHLRDAALVNGPGSGRCRRAWASRCAGAIERHGELASIVYGLAPQPALDTWVAAARHPWTGQANSATSRS